MLCLTHGSIQVCLQAGVRSYDKRCWRREWWALWKRQATPLRTSIYLSSFQVPDISIRGRKGAANWQYNLLYAVTYKWKRSWKWGNQNHLLYWTYYLSLLLKAFLLHSLRLRFHHNAQGHAGWPSAVLGSIIFLLHFSPETGNKFTSWRST